MKNLLSIRKALVFGPALAFALGTSTASATTISYNFTSDHCTGGCLTGQTNGGTVTVTDNGTGELDFLVQLANGNQFVNTGFDASFGFNLNGISQVTYSDITPVSFTIPGEVAPAGSGKQNAGSLHMDGTGFFDFGLEATGSGGSDPNGSTLSFTIAAVGLDITDLEKNAKGELFAADIISGTTGKTGGIDASVANPTPRSVPDGGSTLTLLGSALLGLGMLRRKLGRN